MVNLENVHEVVWYHAPTPDQLANIAVIREASENFMRVILGATPVCEDQAAALRKVREAMMTANAAVVLEVLV